MSTGVMTERTKMSFQQDVVKPNFNPKLFFGGGILFAFLLFALFMEVQKKDDKNVQEKQDLEDLKTKIRSGQELKEEERKFFCDLMWSVEKIAVDNCEKLTLLQYKELIERGKGVVFKTTHHDISEKLGIEVDEYESVKRKKILPKYYRKSNSKAKINKAENPDLGYWGSGYLAFRPSISKKLEINFVLYTFVSLDTIKQNNIKQ